MRGTLFNETPVINTLPTVERGRRRATIAVAGSLPPTHPQGKSTDRTSDQPLLTPQFSFMKRDAVLSASYADIADRHIMSDTPESPARAHVLGSSAGREQTGSKGITAKRPLQSAAPLVPSLKLMNALPTANRAVNGGDTDPSDEICQFYTGSAGSDAGAVQVTRPPGHPISPNSRRKIVSMEGWLGINQQAQDGPSSSTASARPTTPPAGALSPPNQPRSGRSLTSTSISPSDARLRPNDSHTHRSTVSRRVEVSPVSSARSGSIDPGRPSPRRVRISVADHLTSLTALPPRTPYETPSSGDEIMYRGSAAITPIAVSSKRRDGDSTGGGGTSDRVGGGPRPRKKHPDPHGMNIATAIALQRKPPSPRRVTVTSPRRRKTSSPSRSGSTSPAQPSQRAREQDARPALLPPERTSTDSAGFGASVGQWAAPSPQTSASSLQLAHFLEKGIS